MEAVLNKQADMAILSEQVVDYWLQKPPSLGIKKMQTKTF